MLWVLISVIAMLLVAGVVTFFLVKHLGTTDISEDRLKFYLGGLSDRKKILVDYTPHETEKIQNIHDQTLTVTARDLQKATFPPAEGNLKIYSQPLLKSIERIVQKTNSEKYWDIPFYFMWGDSTYKHLVPTIVKARRKGDQHGIITKLELERHWDPLPRVNENDIPWADKKSNVVWRGAETGWEKRERYDLATLYSDKYDIGLVQCPDQTYPVPVTYKKPMNMKEQLQYKFLISLEGNDVASGLKWQLLSNSCVIMPPIHCESWAQEARLKPYVHFLPLSPDLHDLDKIFKWAEKHDAKCQTIAANATQFMQRFLDAKRERDMEDLVLQTYLDKVQQIKKPVNVVSAN